MKIKKTYTHSRVGLLVGLLSFHTLYSCVHTGQELGMGLCQSKEAREIKELEEKLKKDTQTLEQGTGLLSTTENSLFSYPKKLCGSSKKTVPCAAKVGGIGVAVLVIGGVAYLVYNNMLSPATPIATIPTNTTVSGGNETTALESNLARLGDMVNTTAVPFIVNTMKTVGTTVGTVGIAALNTTGLIATLMPNRSNDNNVMATPLRPVFSTTPIPSLVTEGKSSDLVKDPMVLSKEIEKDFEENGVSESRMKYWKFQGVNIKEAKDPRGRNLLMIAAGNEAPTAVRFTIDEGVDVNAQDAVGNTPLHYVVHNSKPNNENNTRIIIRDLLASGADPCVENKKGKKASSYAKSPKMRKLLQEAERKCKA